MLRDPSGRARSSLSDVGPGGWWGLNWAINEVYRKLKGQPSHKKDALASPYPPPRRVELSKRPRDMSRPSPRSPIHVGIKCSTKFRPT